jgi:DeoR family transcriptional regulator, fructose operon transcriptional repressor
VSADSVAPQARFAAERQAHVMAELARLGRVAVSLLAADLEVSTESIRKDLAALEEQGLLRRVHGGAIPVRELTFEPQVEHRTEYTAEKHAIARAALTHLTRTTSVLIDAGSTTAVLAAVLPSDHAGLVCTNSLPIGLSLAARGVRNVRMLGGAVRRPTLAGVGRTTLDALDAVNVDVAFLGTNGISRRRGLTTPDEEEALVKNRMLATARRRLLLADSSKFGLESLCWHAGLGDIDLLITDPGVADDDVAFLEAAGVQVEIAGSDQ